MADLCCLLPTEAAIGEKTSIRTDRRYIPRTIKEYKLFKQTGFMIQESSLFDASYSTQTTKKGTAKSRTGRGHWVSDVGYKRNDL